MDREGILDSVPPDEELEAVDKGEMRWRVENLIDATLLAIEYEHRDPDAWEADRLYSALGAIYHRRYWLALTNAKHALVDPSERSPSANKATDKPATIQEMRDALAFTRSLKR
jgi:hypothetical protein